MKWVLSEPCEADVVRVKIGNFYHYGIYVSDAEIIQFGLPSTDLRRDVSKVEVCISNIDEFLCGNFIEVGEPDKKEKKKMYSPKEIVQKARERIGEKGYHILYNNCEHFVWQCVFGKKVCSQVDAVREMWKKYPFVNVYIEKFPFKTKNDCIYPQKRLEEIENCKNQDIRSEKYYDWKLLEYGIKQSLGLDIKTVDFRKKYGKWICDDFEFSLSHSGEVVAVVVARNPVGVDIEEKNTERFSRFSLSKILSQEEQSSCACEADNLNKIWTVKEALFKKGENKNFSPEKISTLQEKYQTKSISVDGQVYYLTVATNDLPFIKYHLGEGVTLS